MTLRFPPIRRQRCYRGFAAPAHIRYIARKLEAIERGEIKRLNLPLVSTRSLATWRHLSRSSSTIPAMIHGDKIAYAVIFFNSFSGL
jgi:hypothetical protein